MNAEDEFAEAMRLLEGYLDTTDPEAKVFLSHVYAMAYEMKFQAHSDGFEDGWKGAAQHVSASLGMINAAVEKIKRSLA